MCRITKPSCLVLKTVDGSEDFCLPLDLLLNLDVILISQDWHDKAPKTGWLEITRTKIY